MQPKELVDYAASLDCIHCGLCLRTCPTYRITGAEPSSPRGRIYMMRAVAEGALSAEDGAFREEMEFCLACRHCESVCPAGVRFGEMIETARAGIERTTKRPLLQRIARRIGFGVVLPSRAWLRASVTLLGVAQWTRVTKLIAPLRFLPKVPRGSERLPLPDSTPARAPKRGDVAVLAGCVMPELYGRVNHATVEVLGAIGFEVHVPREHVCCGALHAHNGELDGALELARTTIASFERYGDAPVVVNSAGCGAHMKGYGHLLRDDAQWKERAQRFARRVVDFSEFVAARAPVDWQPKLDAAFGTLTYDDPCHLCHGQQVRAEPRALLDLVAKAQRVDMHEPEACCGSAGLYSLLRPADSQAVFAAKLSAFDASGADVLVTANPGCHLQWQTGFARAGRDARVVHIAEVLAEASRARP